MSTAVIEAALTPTLQFEDGSKWRVGSLGEIQLDNQGAVSAIHCVLIPAACQRVDSDA